MSRNFVRGHPSNFASASALPASLPERVNPVHETCAGLVCPGDLIEIAGVFYFSFQPGFQHLLGFLDADFVVRGEELHRCAIPPAQHALHAAPCSLRSALSLSDFDSST